jgi:hypothetical protein
MSTHLPPAARSALETMANRLRNIRRHTEQAVDRATIVGVSGGTALAFGYINERFGSAPASDAAGLKEYTILKVPLDMAVAGVSLAALFLNGFGKYDLVGLGLANGAGNAVLYRMGAEFARKHVEKPAAKAAGEFMPPTAAPWTPRAQQHAAYAPYGS